MAKELAGLDKQKLKDYWSYNVKLTSITMFIWFVVTYVAIFFAPELDKIVIFGFPFGYYMGAQGSLIVFVILIFNYSNKMNKADVDYGVQEEEE
jgi:putative solute:sodium symporter small subunit